MARVARLGVVIDSSGAKKGADETKTALDGISGTAVRAQRTVVQAMSAIGAALGIREVVQLADSWTRLEGRLKTVTSSAADLASVQGRLVSVANATRTGLEETIGLYTRLARSGADLGLSQSDLIRLTELTAKTLTVSGATAASASGSLMQLSQALGGGVVRAEEFNSILEGTPVIVQEVAKSMGVTTSELRRLVNEGNISSREFAEAFLAANGRISDSFDKLGPTVEGALTQLSNAFAETIGRGNQAGGATQELARAIVDMAAMIRENQKTFDAMGQVLAEMVRWGTAAADAFLKAGDAVDELGRWIDGAAKATEGLANFDPAAWTEGIERMARANDGWDASIQRVGTALMKTREEQTRLSAEGLAYMNRLTGAGNQQLTAQPFGMFGGLGTSTAAVAASTAATRANTEAKKQAEAMQKAITAEQREFAKATREAEQSLKNVLNALEEINDIQSRTLTLYVDQADAIDRDRAAVAAAAKERQQNAQAMLDRQAAELELQGKTVAQQKQLIDLDRFRVALASGFTDAQAEQFVRQQRALDDANAASVSFVDTVRDLLGVTQLVAQAFGDVGQQVAGVATGAQSIVSGLQRAGSIKNKAGNAVSLGGALSGAAGITGVVSGLGAVGAVVGGVVQVADALDLFGRKAKERAKEIAEATKAFNEGIVALRTRALGTGSGVGNQLDQAQKDYLALLETARKSFKGSALNREEVRLGSLFKADNARIAADALAEINAAFDALAGNTVAAQIRDAERAMTERANALVALRQAGAITNEEEANALNKVRELFELTKKQIEDTAAAAKAAAEAAEAQKLAQQARDRTAFGLDMTQRRQTLNGDSRGAFITGQTISSNSALAQAQQLVEAGTITAAMFEELKTLLGDEMVAALRDFDEAARQAKQAVQDDLAVRALVATGQSAAAEQKRIEIANARELQGVTDEGLRAQILYVQGLEAVARATEAAAEAERIRQEQNASIDQRMIDALRILDPERAKELEAKQTEIDRAREIANAADEATAARLRELFAMQDAAKALSMVTEELERQKKAAEELADFTRSIGSQYLRSQGKNFDADLADLNDWRTEQLKRAASVGAGADVISQINAIYDARYGALIAAQMKADTPAPVTTPAAFGGSTAADSSITLGEDTVAVRSARSITEATALQLVDYAASQTALLRRLVQLAEGGSGPTGSALASPSLDMVDRQLGARVNTASLLLAGSVR